MQCTRGSFRHWKPDGLNLTVTAQHMKHILHAPAMYVHKKVHMYAHNLATFS